MTQTALVIGSGFGGIASALRLRAAGLEVELIEKLPDLGGRAQVFNHGGYRHDAGPTVITAPFLFDELFALFGEERADHIEFRPLTPWYRFVFPDGDHFDYGGTLEETLADIARIHPPDCAGYEALVEQSKAIFDVGFTQLAHAPFHQFGTMLKQLPQLAKLRSDRTVWDMVCQYLEHDKYVRRSRFNRYWLEAHRSIRPVFTDSSIISNAPTGFTLRWAEPGLW